MTSQKTLKDVKMHYCPGCGHRMINKLIAHVIDEMGLREKTIMSSPVGCSVLVYDYLDLDVIECAHGRVPSVLSAIKRCLPDRFVLGYQGDGDLAAIGTNETIHTANRGENITIIFINNAVYGMTGGQMAPTSLPGQVSTTTPKGRGANFEGNPIKMCELLATLDGPTYIERLAMNSAGSLKNIKEALKKAFQCQQDGKGYSFIEILSPCPTGWKNDIKESLNFVDKMQEFLPVGVFKDERKNR